MSNFSNRLKALRTEKGITQKELANLLHVSQNAIHNWETGKREPKIETIKRIAAALEVNYMQLIDVEEIPITKDLLKVRPDIKQALTQGISEMFETSEINTDKRLIELLKNDTSDKVVSVLNEIIETVGINDKYQYIQINLVDIDKKHLLESFDKLNSIGRNEAIKRVAELAEIPKYTKEETDELSLKAAHNDYILDEGELEIVERDIEKLKKPNNDKQ